MRASVPWLLGAWCLLPWPAAGFQAAAATVKRIRTDMAVVQKDSPLQVIGMRTSLEDLAEQLHVANISAKTAVRVQFGWTVDGCGKTPARLVFPGLPMDAVIGPGMWATVGRQGIDPARVRKAAADLGESCAEVTVGVIHVRFADGSEWNYPLEQEKRFQTEQTPEVVRKLAPLAEEMRKKTAPGQ